MDAVYNFTDRAPIISLSAMKGKEPSTIKHFAGIWWVCAAQDESIAGLRCDFSSKLVPLEHDFHSCNLDNLILKKMMIWWPPIIFCHKVAKIPVFMKVNKQNGLNVCLSYLLRINRNAILLLYWIFFWLIDFVAKSKRIQIKSTSE